MGRIEEAESDGKGGIITTVTQRKFVFVFLRQEGFITQQITWPLLLSLLKENEKAKENENV